MRWGLALIAPMIMHAATPRFTVENTDPALAAFSKELVPLCEEWYPRIASILYGPNPPAPPAEVRIVFDEDKIAGRTEGNTIHLSAAEAKRPAKLDYRAVVIHELVHIVQSYPMPARCDGLRILGCALTGKLHFSPTWISEGLADYVTYTAFTGTNRPLLRLGADGQLSGYDETIPYLHGLQQSKLAPNDAYAPRGVQAGKGYQHGYTVASSFLLWLEKNRGADIIRKLNTAVKAGAYRKQLWRQTCGAPLDQLWADFVRASTEQRR